jgi:hypothetical protein
MTFPSSQDTFRIIGKQIALRRVIDACGTGKGKTAQWASRSLEDRRLELKPYCGFLQAV